MLAGVAEAAVVGATAVVGAVDAGVVGVGAGAAVVGAASFQQHQHTSLPPPLLAWGQPSLVVVELRSHLYRTVGLRATFAWIRS